MTDNALIDIMMRANQVNILWFNRFNYKLRNRNPSFQIFNYGMAYIIKYVYRFGLILRDISSFFPEL